LKTERTIGRRLSRGQPASARRQGGFTLIEIVVAFVMLSLVLVTSFEIFTGGMRRAADLEDYSRALVLATGFEIFSTGLRRAGDLDGYSRAIVVAQSKLASVGLDQPLQAGAIEGESEDGRVHWVLDMQPVEDEMAPGQPQPGPGTYMLYRVQARVDWAGPDARRRTYTLSTMALGVRQ
jgi:general secretion pathway protein I